MPDQAVLLGLPFGQASFTVAPVAGDTVTRPDARKYVIGPPINGDPSMAAIYQIQTPSTDTGQTANTYAWNGDQYYSIAPTTWSYAGDTFIPLGGI